MLTIDTAKALASEKRGAQLQRERTRARVYEIARKQGGMDESLEAILVFLHMEELRERQEDKPTG